MPEPHCVRQKSPDDNAVAVLATVAKCLGNPLNAAQIRVLVAEPAFDLALFLGAARRVGLQAVAMEGPYDELASVELPIVLALSEDDANRFVVLHEVDGAAAVIADPARGVVRVPREELCAMWHGDVVALQRDPEAEAKALMELRQLRRVGSRTAWTGAILLLAGLALGWPDQQPLARATLLALTLCLAGSSWSALFAQGCAACSRVVKLVGGLPLAEVGTLFYAALWTGWLWLPEKSTVVIGIFAALGVHGYLVGLLATERLRCPPCLWTAAGVAVAAPAAWAARVPGTAETLTAVVVAAFAAAATHLVTRAGRRLYAWRSSAATMAQASAASTLPSTTDEDAVAGRARIVVYKRRGCIHCILFETVHRPALEEAFGSALLFEEREPENRAVRVPLIVIRGRGTPRVVLGLPGDEPFEVLRRTVQSAIDDDVVAADQEIILVGSLANV